MLRKKSILLLFLEHFKSRLLSFDTFSKFEITSLEYFNGDTPGFFTYQIKDNTHTNIIYQFFESLKVFFLNPNVIEKKGVFSQNI